VTAEVTKLANDIGFSDWLSVVAIILSFATFYLTRRKKASLTIIADVNENSFKYSPIHTLYRDDGVDLARYHFSFELLLLNTGNASVFIESVTLLDPGTNNGKISSINFYSKENRLLTGEQILSIQVKDMMGYDLDLPKETTNHKLICDVRVFTPDGLPTIVSLPLILFLDEKLHVKKVESEAREIKYHSVSHWVSKYFLKFKKK
jgi:hypothetical protein